MTTSSTPRFDACPAGSRKCVSTLNDTGYPAFDPVPFTCSAEEALATVRSVVDDQPRTRIVEHDGHYLRTEFTTRVLRFTDTVRFEVDPQEGVIHFRSDSVRYARSDLGKNRKRMAMISALLHDRLG